MIKNEVKVPFQVFDVMEIPFTEFDDVEVPIQELFNTEFAVNLVNKNLLESFIFYSKPIMFL